MRSVLILSNNALSSSRNNGKTLASLFSSFEEFSLGQLYFREEIPNASLSCRYFKISEKQILTSLFSDPGAEIFVSPSKGKEAVTIEKKSIFTAVSRFRDFSLVKSVRDFIFSVGFFRNRKLDTWLDSICPNVVFFVAGGGIFSYRIALKLAQSRGIPLIVYFTDDYLVYPKGGLLFRLYQKRLLAVAKKVVHRASSCFAIGESMANEYKGIFGREFSWIMNCSSFDNLALSGRREGKVLQISYFGGLHFQRWKALAKLGNILARMKEDGFLSCLNVYSASELTEEMHSAFQVAGVFFRGAVFGEDLLNKVEDADVLVHVECDEPAVLQNTRLSVSTKIPEYLSSGRLVLGFGPSNVASLELLKKYNLGVVIDSSISEVEVEKQLRVLWNKDIFEEALISAKTFMATTLNTDEMRKRLFCAIRTACGE